MSWTVKPKTVIYDGIESTVYEVHCPSNEITKAWGETYCVAAYSDASDAEYHAKHHRKPYQ